MSLTITFEDELAKEGGELLLRVPHLTEQEFYEFCQRNPLLPVERTKEGDILVMAPADSFSDSRNLEFAGDLLFWNRSLSVPGVAFGPSAGFTLSNGAVRSPDAAWISPDRWKALPIALRMPYAHIAPDFAAEIMSPSDRLAKAQEKMEEYMANGVRLGWLIDRANHIVYIYRPNVNVEILSDPATVSGDPELPGLVINMVRVLQDTL